MSVEPTRYKFLLLSSSSILVLLLLLLSLLLLNSFNVVKFGPVTTFFQVALMFNTVRPVCINWKYCGLLEITIIRVRRPGWKTDEKWNIPRGKMRLQSSFLNLSNEDSWYYTGADESSLHELLIRPWFTDHTNPLPPFCFFSILFSIIF